MKRPLLLAALALATPAGAATPTPPGSPTLRGLWIDAFGPGLSTPAQVERTVTQARALGVNTLFVQAIRRADCLCTRASVPTVTDVTLTPDFDPLAALTRSAHANDLKVIAWVSVTGAWHAQTPNTSPQHVFAQHGPTATGRNDWLQHRQNGTWRAGDDAWLDPAHPDAATFMTDAIVSLVRQYDVDGVQLDRIRSPDGPGWGYNATSVARYRAETGARTPPAPNDSAWAAWRREQVTNLVRRITLGVKSLKPNAWVSAATITYGAPPSTVADFRRTRAYTEVLQDWPTWLGNGLLDLNVPMNYKADARAGYAAWFDGWNTFTARVARDTDTLAAAGAALYLNPPAASAAQAKRTLQAGLGWVGYSYRTPTDTSAGDGAPAPFEAVRAALTSALGPFTPWTATPPAVRALSGRIVGAAMLGGQTVRALVDGRVIATTRTDGNGEYGFLRLPVGRVEVRVGNQAWTDTVRDGQVTRLPDLLLRDLTPAR
ncbi:glycoside hydrolase family 10 protein [Deinococcus maricopensis]|uniref:Glycosyl hydrolase-like 10 domain-containing protein n=1 Tax=Deinococcus maricopensis (strain DSM 21211 / LMG 22137 / NRRL B-23946 / LB-34) TaxID=709986 RepID=E8UBN4_DEIML|nr:family 10 glycosylhydrolase [Deinococcus maricopensis]ADV68473.1 protein of unknown function DUF187 [Deinococcus maricopensis DSM 21211]